MTTMPVLKFTYALALATLASAVGAGAHVEVAWAGLAGVGVKTSNLLNVVGRCILRNA